MYIVFPICKALASLICYAKLTRPIKQVTSRSMHSIVTTFREAVIKVEVANFGAAIDTLIDQDDGLIIISELTEMLQFVFFVMQIPGSYLELQLIS